MKNTIKLISIILIISIIANVMLTILFTSKSIGAQTVSSDIDNINDSKYPGIKSRIKALQSSYPNWKFKILYTGLDWKNVIANEYSGHGAKPVNLIPNSSNYKGAWLCPVCKETPYDNGSWRCVSEQGIKYMMDPRNSMNVSDIFQFEELTNTGYDMNIIRTMTSGSFLAGHENAIVNSSVSNNMNPYYVIARLLQEQGKGGTIAVLGQGYKGQYVGYYNAFNIAASGNSEEQIILNELAYAQKKGWTSLDASIAGGISYIAKYYLKEDQNTLYLQKFDVVEKGGLYNNQYMQNILAAQSEGTTIRDVYIDINTISYTHTFIIPVYENMPQEVCSRPGTSGSDTTTDVDLVRVNVDTNLMIRNAPAGSTILAYLDKNEIVTRLEKATTKVNGTYWDKVKKSNGVIGYSARETYDYEKEYKQYLVPITNNSSEGSSGSSQNTGTNTAKVKIDNSNNIITVSPDAIANDILVAFGGPTKITKADGNFLDYGENHPMGTGFIVLDRYTVVKKGDCTGDGKVNSSDALQVLKYSVGSIAFDQKSINAGDTNKDGKVNSTDALQILKYSVGSENISI